MTDPRDVIARLMEAKNQTIGMLRGECESHITDAQQDEIAADVFARLQASDAAALAALPSSPPLSSQLLSDAPCDQCGYSGAGYYQPDTHPCAAAHHRAVARMVPSPFALPSLPPLTGGPIQLTDWQERAVTQWAADDRLWTTQETVEFNLRTFARTMIATNTASSPPPETDLTNLSLDYQAAFDQFRAESRTAIQPALDAVDRSRGIEPPPETETPIADPVFAAALCATLKAECEAQHARAEKAEAKAERLEREIAALKARLKAEWELAEKKTAALASETQAKEKAQREVVKFDAALTTQGVECDRLRAELEAETQAKERAEQQFKAISADLMQRTAQRNAETQRRQEAERREKCDKCGTLVPPNYIAIELKDGAPIDDPAGFQWCIVCHGQRVMRELQAQLTASEQARQIAEADAAHLRELRHDDSKRYNEACEQLEAETQRRQEAERERDKAHGAAAKWFDDLVNETGKLATSEQARARLRTALVEATELLEQSGLSTCEMRAALSPVSSQPAPCSSCETLRTALEQIDQKALTCAAHMLRASAEPIEKMAIGYGAEQMRSIAALLDSGAAAARAVMGEWWWFTAALSPVQETTTTDRKP